VWAKLTVEGDPCSFLDLRQACVATRVLL
jgi:hypothetical protein